MTDKSNTTNDVIVGTLFIASSTFGAGILALPVMVGLAGWRVGLVGLILCWLMMVSSANVIIKHPCLNAQNADFTSLYEKTFGRVGKYLTVVIYLFLFYGLLTAYMSGIDSTIASTISRNVPYFVNVGLPVLFLMLMVYFGAKVVFKFNSALLLVMLVIFGIIMMQAFAYKNLHYLTYSHAKFLWAAFPAIICSYGFHNAIPTVHHMLRQNSRHTLIAVFSGSLIVLAVNIIFLFIVDAVIPLHVGTVSLLSAYKNGLPITIPLSQITHSSLIQQLGVFLTLLLMCLSFLAVGICLKNFINDFFSTTFSKKRLPTWASFFLTFAVPIFIALVCKNIFLKAISIASGIGAVTIFGLMPCVIAIKEKRFLFKSYYAIIFICFALILGAEVLQQLQLIHIELLA